MQKTALSQPLSMTQLLFVEAMDKLHQMLRPTPLPSQPFPQHITEYTFVQQVEKIGTACHFDLAIYQNDKGQKAFAKLWRGSFHSFSYHSLKNEITVYSVLNTVLARCANKLPSRLQHCHLPKLITWQETRSSLLELIEFVDGDIANTHSTSEKLNAYWQVVEFLTFLGDEFTLEEKKYIAQRGVFDYLLLFVVVWPITFWKRPDIRPLLIKGIGVVMSGIPGLLQQNYNTFTHRDLHFKNILLSPSQTTVIDLQLCVRTIQIYEVITTLRYRWEEDDLHKKLLTQIKQLYGDLPQFRQVFRALAVISATHGLTGMRFPQQKIQYWKDFLQCMIEQQ